MEFKDLVETTVKRIAFGSVFTPIQMKIQIDELETRLSELEHYSREEQERLKKGIDFVFQRAKRPLLSERAYSVESFVDNVLNKSIEKELSILHENHSSEAIYRVVCMVYEKVSAQSLDASSPQNLIIAVGNLTQEQESACYGRLQWIFNVAEMPEADSLKSFADYARETAERMMNNASR